MTSDLVKRIALFVALGVALSACTGMGTTVDPDDPEMEIPNASLGRSIMEGLGAVPARQSPINYTPRAPLVIPKDTVALAAPVDPSQLSQDPNWPVDPDVQMVRTLQEAERRENARGDRGNLVPASQLLDQRLPPAQSNAPASVPGSDPASQLVSPTALMNSPTIGGSDTALYDSQGRPVRRALTEPPVKYLEPAPGAPVVIPEEPEKSWGLFNWFGS